MKKGAANGPEAGDGASGLWPKARGVFGALLGAFSVSYLALVLLFSGPEKIRAYGILFGVSISFGAVLGYWLFRGARDSRFARRTVYAATALAPFLAVPAKLSAYALGLMDWPAPGSAAFFQCLGAGLRGALTGRSVLLAAVHMLFGLLCANAAAGFLIRYADTAFWNSPRRLALQRAGGLLYNFWPEGGPDWQPLPPSFQVGVIRVTGETVRVEPPLRKGRTFSVWDAAGMIVGPSNGSCVIYGFQEEVLARFGMANQNAALLVQYLQEHGVPFSDCDGNPLEAPRTKAPAAAEDVSFVVPMRSTALATGVLGLCLAGSIVLALLVLALSASRGKPLTQAMIFFPLFGVAFPAIPLCAAGQLFPGLLAVEKGRLYRQSIWTKKRRELTDLGYLRISGLDKSYVLYSRDEIILAAFSGKSPHADQLLEYLATRHITPPAKG